jgi:hypothetical protein
MSSHITWQYDRIELKNDSESEYRDRSEDESESEIKIISCIEHEIYICSRCEIFSRAIAIASRWIRESFRLWFLIDRDNELINWLRQWFRNRCDERRISDRDTKRWVLEMIVVIIRFDHRWSKFCRIARKFNNHITDSSFTFKSWNESFHDSDWLTFFSRYTRTLKFSDRIWIRVENESFRMFNASFSWRMMIDFRISFIVLRIATNRWVIIDENAFISIMRKYASKINKMSIKSFESIESFKILNVICNVEFESMFDISAMMITYILRSESWYRSIISIEWCVSIDMIFTLILILKAYCLNSRAMNCLFAFNVMKSNKSK